nr:hypothetical protein BaRGS_024502 [Batillaria attramentaria]
MDSTEGSEVGAICIMHDEETDEDDDCHHGYYDGRLRKHGVYWILPTRAQRPFKVYCHLKGARPRTYIMNRIDNSATISFDRKWADYQRGFGDPEADFWLGLDNIHVLTYSEVYHVRFRIRQLNPEQNLYQQYYHVRVASGDDLYRVTFDDNTTAGNLGDSFSPSNGAKFSTADNDNDGNANVNCAALHKAGWWFKDSTCSLCNPTGPLLRSGDGKVSNAPGEAFWTFDLGDTAPHKISIYLVNF